ncbi:MAG: endonuclease/exonuclease/phosphatase family protein [Lachnospiraceae bacterium]|nr:endonuclease/exonuclease/phosphatase family protein [Lachnospiraceae bacterium]
MIVLTARTGEVQEHAVDFSQDNQQTSGSSEAAGSGDEEPKLVYYAKDKALQMSCSEHTQELRTGQLMRIVSWNTGYGALGDNADFFMDGGTHVYTASRSRVEENLLAIRNELQQLSPDVIFLQEVDTDSARSYRTDESAVFRAVYNSMDMNLALNFKTMFLPYPLPPIGKVESGIMTLSSYRIAEAERVQLPCPFKWPVRVVNLKRCLLLSRLPVADSTKEVVLINLHLEAFDDGEGKIAQTKALLSVMESEREKGNYVIVGGDFNQTFSNYEDRRPEVQEGLWTPGMIDASAFGDSWQLLMDGSTPSGRSLDRPYEGAEDTGFQFYLIDGFIVSDNVKVNAVATQNLGFRAADHNPVVLDVELMQG